MRTVFEPSNALEGYMLQDLLKQRGIPSRLDGAQLQGGVGELPVSGFVRLLVEDDDYPSARAVVDEWESASVSDPIPAPAAGPMRGLLGLLVGLTVGVLGTYLVLRIPLPADGIDHNEDGSLDELWFRSPGGAMVRTEVDRNFDGRADKIFYFDRRGRVDHAKADENFDGSMETRWQFRDGNASFGEADTDGDTFVDRRFHMRFGVPTSTEFLVGGSERPARIEYYENGKLATAEVDSNGDGRLDTRYTYSGLAEIVGRDVFVAD